MVMAWRGGVSAAADDGRASRNAVQDGDRGKVRRGRARRRTPVRHPVGRDGPGELRSEGAQGHDFRALRGLQARRRLRVQRPGGARNARDLRPADVHERGRRGVRHRQRGRPLRQAPSRSGVARGPRGGGREAPPQVLRLGGRQRHARRGLPRGSREVLAVRQRDALRVGVQPGRVRARDEREVVGRGGRRLQRDRSGRQSLARPGATRSRRRPGVVHDGGPARLQGADPARAEGHQAWRQPARAASASGGRRASAGRCLGRRQRLPIDPGVPGSRGLLGGDAQARGARWRGLRDAPRARRRARRTRARPIGTGF